MRVPFVALPIIELCEPSAIDPVGVGLAPAGVADAVKSPGSIEDAATDQTANEIVAGHIAYMARAVGDGQTSGSATEVCQTVEAVAADGSCVASTCTSRASRSWRFWRPSKRRIIILAAIVIVVRIFVGEASVVPTASMEGTILVGDHLFMDKLLYGPEIPLVHWRLPMLKTIRRGDIVVFRYPKDPSETFLKRVTAVGGDRLEIREGVLFVNSQAVVEPYAVHHAPIYSRQESWGPMVVPAGQLFVMGDNRDNSSDSRDWGFVPVTNVIGEPMFVYWSYDAPTSRWLDENPRHRISFYASIVGNFFSRTRWSRTGTLL